MEKLTRIIKSSYIFIIVSIFYIPILFMTLLSFNKPSSKGQIAWNHWNGFSWSSWNSLGQKSIGFAFINTLIIGILVALITLAIAILTVYGLWRQKRIVKNVVSSTANIPLINPDIVTAISLSITLSILFGTLTISNEGIIRVIISHVISILPYAILLLYPRSEKFQKSLLEASKDLGYNPFLSWIRTYIPFMRSQMIASFFVATALSFDDFILTRITSNTTTIGTLLYQGEFKGWGLAIGAILLITVLIGVSINMFINSRKVFVKKRGKREK